MEGSLSAEPQSKAVGLINLASEYCIFFYDQHGTPFAFTKNPGKTMQLRGREFKTWLVRKFYDEESEAVGTDALNAALNVLEASASSAKRVTLSTRCSTGERGELYIDLANEVERAVVIDHDGWREVQLLFPRFRRYSHMLPMTVSNDADDVRDFVHFLRLKEQADEVLLVGFLGHAFISEIPHAVLMLVGPKGSAKTTCSYAIRQMIDPSSMDNLTIGERGSEFIQQLAHNYVPVFDNVNKLQVWQADDLCRASTGAGFSKRGLYTDDDDVIFQFKRVPILNGLNTPSQRADLLDRSLLLEFSRIPKHERKEDRTVRAEIEKRLPKVRRSIFDALVKATGHVDQVRKDIKELPRMADFAVWGEAFCRSVGYPPLAFYSRLMEKVDETAVIALENDVVAELLHKLFNSQEGNQYLTRMNEYAGTASELLKVIQNLNEDLKHSDKRDLPRSPDSLSRRLGELSSDLEERGIKISRERTGKRRGLLIRWIPPEGSDKASLVSQASPVRGTIQSQNDADDASDASPRPSGGRARILTFDCGSCGKTVEPQPGRVFVLRKKRLCEDCWAKQVSTQKGETS